MLSTVPPRQWLRPDALFDYRHSQVMIFKEDGLGFPGVDSCEVKELQG